MDLDVKQVLTSQLDWYWQWMLLPRLEGVTDKEFLWEPVADAWNVRLTPDGRWMGDWQTPSPDPPPFTTIAWRMLHITSVLAGRAAAHFGTKPYDFEAGFTGRASEAIAGLQDAYSDWSSGLEAMADERLTEKSEGPPGTIDGQFPFAAVIQHVNREVIHHGAEVATLRDLYRHQDLQRRR